MAVMTGVLNEDGIDKQSGRVWSAFLHDVTNRYGTDIVAVQEVRGRESLGADLVEDSPRLGPRGKQRRLLGKLSPAKLLVAPIFERPFDGTAASDFINDGENIVD